MRILVTYGSKRGGTAGISEMLARAFTEQGFQADARPATDEQSAEGYDAVIVGGALYANRWHRAARRFVRRHSKELWGRPVWLFSSGPLDDSAARDEIPPVAHVQRLMQLARAQGHMTFGGRLEPDAKGFIASKMARQHSGDWRDPRLIRAWAEGIGEALRSLEQKRSRTVEPSPPPGELHV